MKNEAQSAPAVQSVDNIEADKPADKDRFHIPSIDNSLFSHGNFSDILLQLPGIFVIVEGYPEMVLTFANHAFFRSFSRGPEVLGKPLLEAMPELKDQKFPALLKQVFDTGIAYEHPEERTIFYIDGVPVEKFYNNVFHPIFDDKKKVTGIAIMSTDITEQVVTRKKLEECERQLEAKILERTFELQKEIDFSETILNTTKDMIGVYDTEMRIIAFNKACEDFFHIKKEDVIGKIFYEVFPAAKNGKGYHDLKRALQGEVIHNQDYHSPVSGRHYENFITPLRDESGKIYAAVAIAHDITDIREANVELMKMNKELESFVYISSHDLQEPLRKIQMFSKRILDKEIHVLSDTGKSIFGKMDFAANRMQQLINDLLSYSRTSSSAQHFEMTDLGQVLEDIQHDLQEKIANTKTIIESDDLPILYGIPFQLKQLFTNLLTNSIKFSRPGTSPHIQIRSHLLSADSSQAIGGKHTHHISFRDNGMGFNPEFNQHIFGLFHRLHGRHEYEGTGIGLAIAKKIIDNHNGRISAEGIPGEGTTIDIFLPASN